MSETPIAVRAAWPVNCPKCGKEYSIGLHVCERVTLYYTRADQHCDKARAALAALNKEEP